ncbi:MAG: hypothetical protein CMH96_01970 [Oceanospirillaceae bacterium]|nr:hypothetical protein [Oceanospirillaceae bacterium]
MSFAFAGLNILLLIFLAHRDFWHLHVPNLGMFALLVVWGVQLYWMQPDDWFFNLLTGAGFFAVGILFWRWRKISASEAKLLLVVGLILGWPCCLVFVVLLPIMLILQFAFLRRWELTGRSHHIVLRRLRLLIKKKRLPAGLSIVAAAIISQFYLLLTS